MFKYFLTYFDLYFSHLENGDKWFLHSVLMTKRNIACKTQIIKMTSQLCLTLCNPMDCSLPSSSVHGILQARILECVAMPFSRGSSWPRGQTWIFYIAGRFFTIWVTREARLTLCKHYVLALGSSGRKQVLLFKCRTRRQTASQGLCPKCSQDASHERWMLTLWRAACLRLRRASQGSIE